MSLFQNSVLNKYLKQQDKDAVAKAYKKFAKYFHDNGIQENIRSSKEEEYQGIFLTELFSKVLDYTIKPNANFNLVAEYKNEKNSRKADGAILKDDQAIGVIELKGTNTKDLEKIRLQAFDYKANQTGCVYVITSNFEKIRFYINNAVDFEEFDLFNLKQERFALLYLCLAKDNVLNNIPLQIKEGSIQEEEAITKQFYKDYSLFKRELFRDLVKLNMKNDVFRAELNNEDAERANKNIKHNLFKKSQKLIDRFLFIFFAEDRGLLPPNSTIKILDNWDKLNDLDASVPLYDRYKLYFKYLDQGRAGTDKKAEIFAYNGGLFKPDGILDSLVISDALLYKHTKELQAYDFDSQVDVNILGHIFENSLNEIESVNAEIEGGEFDKQTSKRKKDGVFYTPKYITKYIVDNTVGKLCMEKKAELGVIEEEYLKSRKGRPKAKLKELLDSLEAYREWLLQLTILDPACGSGAFLNQALDFLIKEHSYIDELQTDLLGGGFVFPDIENTVLENNIFGVDLNEESVEIAKLSLWLRTAQPRRKLNDLSSNIKCGNSLIDSKTVAGDKAFKWEEEFQNAFTKGGFDLVIGNPPYLRVQGLKTHFEDETKFYEKNYNCATRRYDVYSLFMEKAIFLIKPSGRISFILPHKFLIVEAGNGIRKFLADNNSVESIIHFGEELIFSDASVYTCIITLTKTNDKLYFKRIPSNSLFNNIPFDEIEYSNLGSDNWNLASNNINDLILKLSKGHKTVKDIFDFVGAGIDAGVDDVFMLKGKVKAGKFAGYSQALGKIVELEEAIMKPLLKGEDAKRYETPTPLNYILYPHYSNGKKTVPFEEDVFKSKFPLAYEYMCQFKDEMIARKIRKKTNPKYWYGLHRSRDILNFENEKIITPEISLGANMTFDDNGLFHNTKVYYLVKGREAVNDYKYFLAILNSSVMWFYLKSIGYVLRGGYFTFKTKFLEPFPLPILDDLSLEAPFVEKVDFTLKKTKEFNEIKNKFMNYLKSQFAIEKLTKKLQNWHDLEFGDFIKELNKAIKKAGGEKLTKMDEMEWMDVFETKKAEAQALKAEIDKTDAEIDQMVYELYGLTAGEIKIVENS